MAQDLLELPLVVVPVVQQVAVVGQGPLVDRLEEKSAIEIARTNLAAGALRRHDVAALHSRALSPVPPSSHSV